MLDWHIYIIMFQFQTGSIRSYERQAFMKALGVFQFQTGSIRSKPHKNYPGHFIQFQFQTGSIRSWKIETT